ncbi:MAG: cell cycle transcriptional regulator TrcR [Hyphomicrobiales bacterium]
MAEAPLMPKATAVWLVDNTALTFEQIADFCGLHALEVKGIADGEVAAGIKGIDPIAGGQLTREEIERGQGEASYRLRLAEPGADIPKPQRRRGPRYTPVSRRQDRPDAIAWLLRHHPELNDAQIIRLVRTTRQTIRSIRDRTHRDIGNIMPKDPVALVLCTQGELDAAVKKAGERLGRKQGEARGKTEPAATLTLLPAEETQNAPETPTPETPMPETPMPGTLAPEAQTTSKFHATPDEPAEKNWTAETVFAKSPVSAPDEEGDHDEKTGAEATESDNK